MIQDDDMKGLKEGEYRLRINGERTGINVNKKIDTETAIRVINVLMRKDNV